MIPLAIVACVATVCGSGLLGWKWWLQSQQARRTQAVHDFDAAVGRFEAFERRFESLEVRVNTTVNRR